MNENETNPRPADAAADNSSAERVESEQPTLAQPPVAPQSGAPQSAAPQQHSAWAQQSPWQPQQPVSAQPAAAHAGAAQPGAAQPETAQHETAQFGVAQPAPTQALPAQPVSAQPVSAHPGAAHPVSAHPVTAQPASGAPYDQPQYAYQSPQGYNQQPGYQDYTQQQQAYQAWHAAAAAQAAGGGNVPPDWNKPVGAGDQPPPGRGRKIAIAGAAAVLIALASGGVGAATALALSPDGTSTSVQTGNSSVTRVVDRSSLAQIAAAVQDNVVSITTGSGEGSGVVLTAEGYIVTNNHVVSTAQGSSVTVIFADGTKTAATVVGTDERTDLAVIKADGVSSLKAATFGDSSKTQVGDTVLALGSPLGLEGSVTAGIISAKDRAIQSGGQQEEPQSPWGGGQQQQQQGASTMTGLLQTDAPINPGNSGGALVNTNGEVIGINSAIATSGAGTGNIGLGFAIPSNKAKQVAESLMQGKKVSHPALGVSVTNAENGGAAVSAVVDNSAAAKAQLQRGDVVTKVDGKPVDDSDDLVAAVQAGTVGQQMTLTFTRNGTEQTVTVTLLESQ